MMERSMSTSKITLVDSIQHKDLRVNNTNYNTPQNQINMSVVVSGELSSLIHEYPIFVTKNADTGQFQLSAILGFEKGENLYLDGETWRAKHLPLDVLRRPFIVHLPEGEMTEGARLALDMNSDLVSSAEGEALFDDKGEPSEYLQRVQQTFAQLMSGSKHTRELLQTANEFGLLESISLNIDLIEQGTMNLSGLYTFNQKAVSELSGNKLKTCHQNGLLQVCHLVLSSALHLDKLIQWKRQ
jgi:hypothetical protein